jgi:hypothetical protein
MSGSRICTHLFYVFQLLTMNALGYPETWYKFLYFNA